MPAVEVAQTDTATGALGHLLGANATVSDRVKKLIAAYMLTNSAIEIGRRLHRNARARFVYTIAIPSSDEMYTVLHERILALIPEQNRRSIVVRAMRGHSPQNAGGYEIVSPGDSPSLRLRPGVFYDSTKEQTISIGGQRIKVSVETEDQGYRSNDAYFPKLDRIVFTAYGAQARDAVMAFIAETTDGLNEPDSPRFYMPRYGNWYRREDLVPRRLDTVILRAGQKEALLADLRQFLNGRAAYERLGIPWHRGYLLHGPPGTGKTSLARALATELGIDVYYLPISDLELDSSLLQLVASVPARSMLLLEDIDILHAAKARDDGERGVTMSGILNALDGVSTPAGLIAVLTTNHREVLDDAVIRAGRVDREEEIGYLDDAQLQQLLRGFFGPDYLGGYAERQNWPSVHGRKIAPADIAEVLKRDMGCVEKQRAALADALSR